MLLHRPADLVIVQLRGRRKSLETTTETLTIYWIGNLTSPKRSPGVTPHHVQQTVAGPSSSLLEGRGWNLPVIGGIDVRLAHQLPGKPAAGAEVKRHRPLLIKPYD